MAGFQEQALRESEQHAYSSEVKEALRSPVCTKEQACEKQPAGLKAPVLDAGRIQSARHYGCSAAVSRGGWGATLNLEAASGCSTAATRRLGRHFEPRVSTQSPGSWLVLMTREPGSFERKSGEVNEVKASTEAEVMDGSHD